MNSNYMKYLHLCQYGFTYGLKIQIKDCKELVKWTEENFKYVQYNPRKQNNRQGLSITSLNGGMSGIPDLDSLHEYNSENNTSYTERDFSVPTPVFKHKSLENTVGLFKDHMFRTHIIKLNAGGFFPPHRDLVSNFDSFRIIVPLLNFNPPTCNFIIDGQQPLWEQGRFYFVDTAKLHYLFNADYSPSYWIVINVSTCDESVDTVLKYMKY